MRISIIIPCRNEERYIGACLDSVLQTAARFDAVEIFVVDGHSDDATRAIATEYAQRHSSIRVLDNPLRIVPAALNHGIRAATGDVIVRMDAHVVYPPDYLSRLVTASMETGADNVGGCIETLPADASAKARAIAVALSHPFGVGNSYFRIGTTSRRWVDTVPFGCYRRHVFEWIGLFDEELVRNQDDEFNHRLIRAGGRVMLLPDVVSRYYARPSFPKLARMYYQYGLFKPLVARKVGRVMTWRQVVPGALLASLLTLGMLAPWSSMAAATWAAVAGAYTVAVAAAALPASRRHGIRVALWLAVAFPVLHMSYGAGFWRGVWRAVIGRRSNWGDTAAVPLSR